MRQHIPVGILLAAGFGKRFDPTGARNKLLELLENGTPIALQAAQNLRQVLSDVIAVVHTPELAAQFTGLGCRPLIFPHADQGMGASLAYAISVADELGADSVLVALADMPYVQPATIQQIVNALNSGADIVQPVFQKQPGHPVGFSKRHFSALMALTGDTGARHLLHEFPVMHISVDDPGVVHDIDYLSDLRSQKNES
jgi:molybdenum cofactor cytidylyltransferase